MDKNWAEKVKKINKLLGNKNGFDDAIQMLIDFRMELFEQITQIVNDYPEEAFYQMPFPNLNGYHNKTLGYSIWHIFRIEDIVAHELIARDEQILFRDNHLEKIGASIITTGNELSGEEIVDFSKGVNVKALWEYAKAVMESTNEILLAIDYADVKNGFGQNDIELLRKSGSVSMDENAVWLIEYWCGKDVRGLIKMPFSRHWVMHIEAMRRINNKLCKDLG